MPEKLNAETKAEILFDTLLFDVADNVATITLNRPEHFNALNYQMADDYWRPQSNVMSAVIFGLLLLLGQAIKRFVLVVICILFMLALQTWPLT